MVSLFDTSALVASLASAHPQFAWADQQVAQAKQPALCAHSLAETYAVMTAHPQLRYSPTQVQAVLERLTQTWTVVPLTPADYLAAIMRCQALGLPGGSMGSH